MHKNTLGLAFPGWKHLSTPSATQPGLFCLFQKSSYKSSFGINIGCASKFWQQHYPFKKKPRYWLFLVTERWSNYSVPWRIGKQLFPTFQSSKFPALLKLHHALSDWIEFSVFLTLVLHLIPVGEEYGGVLYISDPLGDSCAVHLL